MKKLLLIFILTFISTSVAQVASEFYAGVSVGQSEVKDFCEGISGSCDNEDIGFKVYGGAQVTKNLGIEVSFVDFGEVTGVDTSFGFPVSVSAEVSGFGIAGVGTFPISEKIELFGKVGLFRWAVRWALKSNASGGGASASADEDGTSQMYGVGAKYNLTKGLGIRIEWEQFTDVGDAADTTGEDDLTLLSGGVVFSF